MLNKFEIYQHFSKTINQATADKINWKARLANYENLKVGINTRNSSILISYIADNDKYSVAIGDKGIAITHRTKLSDGGLHQKYVILLTSGKITHVHSELSFGITIDIDPVLQKKILSNVATMMCTAVGISQFVGEEIELIFAEPESPAKKHKPAVNDNEEKINSHKPSVNGWVQCSVFKNPLEDYKLQDYERDEIRQLAQDLQQPEKVIADIYKKSLLQYTNLRLLKKYIQNANSNMYPSMSFAQALECNNDQASTLNIAYDFIKMDESNKERLTIKDILLVPTYDLFIGFDLDRLPFIKEELEKRSHSQSLKL